MSSILHLMSRALDLASEPLLADYHALKTVDFTLKGPGDYVSEADMKSEKILVETLRSEKPEWGFLGEEGTDIVGSDPRYRWIMDPLDGTSNFLHGLPHWNLTVALEKEGDVIAGMTYDPVMKEKFWAEKGSGVFLNGEKVQASQRPELRQALILIDPGHSRKDPDHFAFFQNAVKNAEMHGAAVRVMGAGALDLCYLASGRLDVMVHSGGAKPWDLAAGFLFLRENGIDITDLAMRKTDHYNGQFIAAKPDFHQAFSRHLGLL